MATTFNHDFLLDLMASTSDNDLNTIYEKLYKELIVENRKILPVILNQPKYRPFVSEMFNYFLDKEEYEKCTVLKKIFKSMPQNVIKTKM